MTKLAAVAANFTRDLDQNYALIDSLAEQARTQGVDFLVAARGRDRRLPVLVGQSRRHRARPRRRRCRRRSALDGPEIAAVQQIVGDLVVAIGFCELDDDGETRYNAAAVLDGGHGLRHLPQGAPAAR